MLVPVITSAFLNFLLILFADLASKNVWSVLIPFLFASFAIFVGSIPRTLNFLFGRLNHECTFQSLYYSGQEKRTMFDRRVNDWIEADAYLFPATYKVNLTVEFEVNPEFKNPDDAEVYAQKYAEVILKNE